MVTMLLLFREGDQEQSFANRADRREFFPISETMYDPLSRKSRDGWQNLIENPKSDARTHRACSRASLSAARLYC
jgi:hypothetical protein